MVGPALYIQQKCLLSHEPLLLRETRSLFGLRGNQQGKRKGFGAGGVSTCFVVFFVKTGRPNVLI